MTAKMCTQTNAHRGHHAVNVFQFLLLWHLAIVSTSMEVHGDRAGEASGEANMCTSSARCSDDRVSANGVEYTPPVHSPDWVLRSVDGRLTGGAGSLDVATPRRVAQQSHHQQHKRRRRISHVSRRGRIDIEWPRKLYQRVLEETQLFSSNNGLQTVDSTNLEEKHSRKLLWKPPPFESGPLMTVSVALDGTANFSSIQQAIDSIPVRNDRRVIIRIHAGTYREKVVVPSKKPFITFFGDETGRTVITWNATASSTDKGHENKFAMISNASSTLFGTMQSASVAIFSDGFVAQHVVFENSAPAPEPGAVGAQAVALLIGGDRAAFYYCSFLGAQDTLYDYTGRHYYMGCYIQGSIDFIFGNGRSLFEECELHSIAKSYGAIAAHQRLSPEDDTGFSFDRCSVTGSGLLYLGRAWSPYARIVFARTHFDNIIFGEGWSDFGDPQRQSTTFFGQYQCTGPGANLSQRAKWAKSLGEVDVLPYLTLNFVNGNEWLNTKPFRTLENRTRT